MSIKTLTEYGASHPAASLGQFFCCWFFFFPPKGIIFFKFILFLSFFFFLAAREPVEGDPWPQL